MSTASPGLGAEWDVIQRRALVAAVVGSALFAVVALGLYATDGAAATAQVLLSYLVAYTFWLGVPLGCLVILMLQHLTGGVWGLLLRGILESASRTLTLLAVLFVPFVLGLPWLYLWARPDVVRADDDLAHKALYLNPAFYVLRALVYFAVWLALAFLLNRWSWEQHARPADPASRRFRLLSAPGLVAYGLTITFASVDWVMSLEPYWYSTIYPVLFATGQVLSGLAFAVAVLIVLAERPPGAELVRPQHFNDLGSLLLAFVMFWAYVSISQFLLIWVGNLPEEVPWYLRRARGGWQWIAAALAVLHFAVPFVLLLSRDIKRDRRKLAALAVGLLVMRFVDVLWWIEPAYDQARSGAFWLLDLGATAGLGGVWVWSFVRQLRRRPVFPVNDPYWAEVLAHD